MSFGQLHGFAKHYTHRNIPDFQVSSNLKRLTYEIAIVDECLRRQIGIACFQESFALRTRIDD